MKKVHAIRADEAVFKSLKLMAVDDGVSMGDLFERLVTAEWESRVLQVVASPECSDPECSGREVLQAEGPRLNRRERRALKNKRK